MQASPPHANKRLRQQPSRPYFSSRPNSPAPPRDIFIAQILYARPNCLCGYHAHCEGETPSLPENSGNKSEMRQTPPTALDSVSGLVNRDGPLPDPGRGGRSCAPSPLVVSTIMISFLIVFFGFVFVVLSVFLVLLILVQPGKSGGGIGGLGGGAAGSAISETLGATHGEKTLVRWTSWLAGAFFVIALGLTVLANVKQAAPVSQLNLEETTGAAPAVPAIEQPSGAAAEEPAPGTVAPVGVPAQAPENTGTGNTGTGDVDAIEVEETAPAETNN